MNLHWPKLESAILLILRQSPGQFIPISYEEMYRYFIILFMFICNWTNYRPANPLKRKIWRLLKKSGDSTKGSKIICIFSQSIVRDRRGGFGWAGRAVALPLLFSTGAHNYGLLFSSTPVDMLVRTITTRCGCKMIRCDAQMERFDCFFALRLGERLYCHTDNLSKDLQGT